MAVWNNSFEATPAGTENPSFGDDRIRELKSAVRERLEKELFMDLSGGDAATDGWFRAGAAKVYGGSSAPTTRPDGVTALTADDNGRVWRRSTDGLLHVYVHGTGWVAIATTAATADRMVLRDASGRAKVAAPADADDVARKQEVDAAASTASSNLTTHADLTNPHSATAAATASRLVLRDASGRAKVAAPAAADDIARKAEVDLPLITGIAKVISSTDYALPSISVGQTRMIAVGSSSTVLRSILLPSGGTYTYLALTNFIDQTNNVASGNAESAASAAGGSFIGSIRDPGAYPYPTGIAIVIYRRLS